MVEDNATTPSLYPTQTDLLLAYVESIRYAESRSKGLAKGSTILERPAQPMLQVPQTF